MLPLPGLALSRGNNLYVGLPAARGRSMVAPRARRRAAVDSFPTPSHRAGGESGGLTMPFYETVLITRQEIGGGEAERLGEHYEEILTKEGASVVRREYWGLRRLAYRVRKNRKGHYVMFHVDGPGTAIQEYERQLRIDENVVRYLTMRVDQLPEGPSIIMKARAEREERRDQETSRRDVDRQASADVSKDGERTETTGPAEDAVEQVAPAPSVAGAADEALTSVTDLEEDNS